MRGKSKLEILQKRSENCLAVEAWQTRRYVYDMVGRRKPVINKRGEMPPLPPPKNRSNLQSRRGNASCKGAGRGGLSTLACQNKKKSIVTVKCEKRTVLCLRLPFRWSIDLRDLKDELHVWDEYMYIYLSSIYLHNGRILWKFSTTQVTFTIIYFNYVQSIVYDLLFTFRRLLCAVLLMALVSGATSTETKPGVLTSISINNHLNGSAQLARMSCQHEKTWPGTLAKLRTFHALAAMISNLTA